MTENRVVEPLRWPFSWGRLSFWQRFLRLIPVIGPGAKVWRLLCRQCSGRTWDCLSLWGENSERRRIAASLCSIAQEHCGWPNPLFIPSDPVEIVFWDHTGDKELRSMDIDPKIRSLFSIPEDYEFSYLDFVSRKENLGEMVDSIHRLLE